MKGAGVRTEAPWSSPELVSVAEPGATSPTMVVVGQVPHLVWEREGVLYHSARDRAGWSRAVQIASGSQPALCATANAQIHCLFTNQFAGNWEIYHTVWDGTRWSLPQNVSRTDGASTFPALTVSSSGTLHAAWMDTTPGYPVIYYGVRGKSFWSSVPVPQARGELPALALNPSGDICLSWQDRIASTGCYEVFASIWRGNRWSVPENISDNPAEHSLHPATVLGPGGAFRLVWQDAFSRTYRIRFSDRLQSGWSAPRDLSAPGADCLSPRALHDDTGATHVFWVQGLAIQHRSQPASADGPWTDVRPAVADCPDVADLMPASGPGALHLAWTAVDDYGVAHLYHAESQ